MSDPGTMEVQNNRRKRKGHLMSKHSSGYRVQSVVPRWWTSAFTHTVDSWSPKALERHRMVRFSHRHSVALAADAFGVCDRTVVRWRQRYRDEGMKGLEDRPSAPRKQRQKTWTTAMILAVQHIRQSEDGRGRGKVILQMLLEERGWVLSVSMVGRILAYLKAHGRLPEPRVPAGRQRRPMRPYAIRRPKGTPPPALPGDVVQIDTVHIRPMTSVDLRQYSAIDVISRLTWTTVRTRATAGTARDFVIELVAAMPFPIRTIQVDGGSEFMAEFEEACQALGIVLYVLPPRSPKLNGCVERFNRTTREEFWRWYTGLTTVAATTAALQRWTARYNAIRRHASLGYRTPLDYFATFERTP